MPLTDTACRAARCPAGKIRIRLADAGGLYLEVLASGARYWRWKCRHGGKEKRLALGTYPEVGLAQARLDRDAARLLLKQGVDPLEDRRDRKLADRVRLGTTFEAIARDWHTPW